MRDASVLASGQRIGGRYTVVDLVGAGGMGAVYRAVHDRLRRDVALKVLALAPTPELTIRFEQEGVALGRLRDEAIVEVYDAGIDGDVAWLAMELLVGETLGDAIRRSGRLPALEAASIGRSIATGLAAAHRAAIVHRDLKPDNVFLALTSTGKVQAKILDFGVARLTNDPARGQGPRPTGPGAIVGTPLYLAPEQLTSGRATDRSDLWSLGATLYEALAGRPPFDAPSLPQLVNLLLADKPPDVRAIAPEVPEWIAETVSACLARDPAKRPESAEAVVEALSRTTTDAFSPYSTRAMGPTIRPPAGSAMPPSLKWTGPRTNLPGKDASFIDRDGELQMISLALSQSRMVTLFGPGGTGKTRLAIEGARAEMDAEEGGVWFCDLASARTREDLIDVVARSIQVPLVDAAASFEQRVARALQSRGDCLLVLDNFEQLAAFADTISRWLEAAPALRILATSQTPLRIKDERVIEILPLGPAQGALLFQARAAAVGVTIGADDASIVESIVLKLEGIPLAIELAAARLRVMSVRQLAERLGDRLKLLAGGRRDGPTRQATLRSAIDWSYQLLDERDRVVLMQCSVFRKGFALEAAEGVIDPGADALVDRLDALCDRAMIQSRRQNGDVRFSMLETLREYAAEKLEETGNAKSVKERHAKYMAAWATKQQSLDPPAALRARLRAEAENILAAADHAIANGEPDKALAAVLAIEPVLTASNPGALLERIEAALRGVSSDTENVVFACIVRAAMGMTKDPGGAKTELFDLAERARALGRLDLHALALLDLADCERILGETQSAGERIDAALGFLSGVEAANALARRSSIRLLEGRLDEAEADALAALDGAGDAPATRVRAHMAAEVVCVQRGKHALAEDHLRAALDVTRSIDHRRSEATLLNNLGVIHMDKGEWADADRELHRALLRARELGLALLEGIITGNLGITSVLRDQRANARGYLQSSVRVLADIGDKRYRGWFIGWLSVLAAGEDRVELAVELYMQAVALAHGIDDEMMREAITVLGAHLDLANARVALSNGDVDAAARQHEQAKKRIEHARSGGAIVRAENVRFAVRSIESALGQAM